ncbi:MAG: hypothetical protein IKD43_00110 [Clostridia bacterium]|nr:hypothetical protein [Clostridia bacterium]
MCNSKFGRKNDDAASICQECEAEEAINLQPQRQVVAGSRKEGLKGAIIATILSIVAMIACIFAFYFVYVTILVIGLGGTTEILFISLGICLIGLGFAIPALIFAIKAIRCYVKAKKEERIKPVATLVCGIISLVMSAIALGGILFFLLILALI